MTREDDDDMQRCSPSNVPGRREFLVSGAAAGLISLLISGRCAVAQESAAKDRQPTYDEALKAILGEAKPQTGKLLLDLPEIAENGNTVPFSVSVESPMSETDFVKAIHVLSTANPVPTVASFRFTPLSGKAAASSRMRLAKTQDVVAVAELGNGQFLMSLRNVKVTIGGCGG